MKKKLIIIFIALAAALGIARVGLAYSINSVVNGGKNLLVDGDMEKSGTTSWAYDYLATLSKQTTSPHGGNQVLRITGGASHWAVAIQYILTSGKTYRVTGWARSDGTIPPGIWDSPENVTYWDGTNSTSWQRIDIVFTSNGTIFRLGPNSSGFGSAGQYVEFDDVTVTAYPGKIQNQEKQLLVDGDMEAATVTGFGGSDAAVLSKQTSSPHGGKRVLRVAADGSQTYSDAYTSILTTNKSYRVSGWFRSDGTQVPKVYVGSPGPIITGTNSTSWQRFDTVATAGTAIFFVGQSTNNSGYVEFDDVTVTAYNGKTQNTEKQLLTDGDMEAATVLYTANNSTLTKQTTTPHGGKQALRVAVSGTSAGYALTNGGIITTGRKYRVTGWARSDGTDAPVIYLGGGGGSTAFTGTTATTWQRIDVIGTGVGNNYAYLGKLAGNTGYVEFDDLRITLVP